MHDRFSSTLNVVAQSYVSGLTYLSLKKDGHVTRRRMKSLV